MTEGQFREPATALEFYIDWFHNGIYHETDEAGHCICPLRSDEVRVDIFVLKPPALLNRTAFFTWRLFFFCIQLQSCPMKYSTGADDRMQFYQHYQVQLLDLQPVVFNSFILILTNLVWGERIDIIQM